MGILAVITLEPIMLVFSVAYYIQSVMIQDLVFTMICMTKLNTNSTEDCDMSKISDNDFLLEMTDAQASITSNYYTLHNMLAIPLCFYVGSWGDTFGRKILMIYPFFFFAASQVCLLICALLINHGLTGLVYLAGILDGLSGGNSSLFATLFGYISDITSEQTRTRRIMILEGMWFVGAITGYVVAGTWGSLIGQSFPAVFSTTLTLHISIIVYIVFRVKGDRRPKEDFGFRFFSIEHVKQCVKATFKERKEDGVRRLIIACMLCAGGVACANSVANNLTYSFLRSPPLRWNTEVYSFFNAMVVILEGIGLVVVLPLLLIYGRRRITDSHLVMIGALSLVTYLLMLSNAWENWMVFASAIFVTCVGYSTPSIRALISKIVEDSEKGKIFSFIAVTQNVFQTAASFLFGLLFTTAVNLPGLSFQIGALVALCGSLVFAYTTNFKKGLSSPLKKNENSNLVTEEVKAYGATESAVECTLALSTPDFLSFAAGTIVPKE